MKQVLLALAGLLVAAQGASAEPVGGAVCRQSTVAAYGEETFDVTLYGGETAYILVSGDRDTDLDLFVYDEFGNLVGSDTDYTDQCVVAVTPRWTGRFTIRVVNHGGVYNNFQICAG